jgi:CBS domain-containing protein
MDIEQIVHVRLSQVPSREPVKVALDTRLGDVVGSMHAARTGAALVVDADALAGIFTEHDLLRRVDQSSHAWRDLPVHKVMTPRPRVIREDDTLAEAMRRMDAGKHRHLPVVRGRVPIAILSIRELLAFVASKFPADFINLPPDPDKEARAPWGG